MGKSILAVGVCFALATSVWAAPILTDDFNFTGNLTSNGWTAHSGSGTNPIDTVSA